MKPWCRVFETWRILALRQETMDFPYYLYPIHATHAFLQANSGVRGTGGAPEWLRSQPGKEGLWNKTMFFSIWGVSINGGTQ
jgi:hypothetical protein